jgi:peptidoglycan/xylan/chitin deacetylase (PgdA/CDA1 family)
MTTPAAAARPSLARRSVPPVAAIAFATALLAALAWSVDVTPPVRRAVPIVMYHHVGDWGVAGDWSPWVVKPRDFGAQLDWLVAHGFRTVTLTQLRAHRELGAALPARPVVLTFDDGWAEHAGIARRWLEPRGLRGVFFVYTAAVGGGGFLSWDDLRTLEASGHEVLSHTVGHPDLVRVPDDRLAVEMRESRARLERELGHPVETIAYPFGSFDARVVRAAADAGYRMAVLATGGNEVATDPRLEMPRWKMEYGEPIDRFVQQLGGR